MGMERTSDTILRLLRIERRGRPEAEPEVDFWVDLVLKHADAAPKTPEPAPTPAEHPGHPQAA